MNQKWLEIYKKYRKRKYERDLDKLRNDLANRGLSRSSIRENEERWLKEDCDDEVTMKQEEIDINKEESRVRKNSIWTNRILVIVSILSFLLTLGVSYITAQHSKEALELNYSPSIDVQYDAPNEQIQVYNRGKSNLYIWGSRFNNETIIKNNWGMLITPAGLPYHFPGINLNQGLAKILDDKEMVYVPIELFFKDNRGDKYVSNMFFYVFRKDKQMAIDVQVTSVSKYNW